MDTSTHFQFAVKVMKKDLRVDGIRSWLEVNNSQYIPRLIGITLAETLVYVFQVLKKNSSVKVWFQTFHFIEWDCHFQLVFPFARNLSIRKTCTKYCECNLLWGLFRSQSTSLNRQCTCTSKVSAIKESYPPRGNQKQREYSGFQIWYDWWSIQASGLNWRLNSIIGVSGF